MITKEINNRYCINITRNEALLIKEALYFFAEDRSASSSWDSQIDPIVVDQMLKKLNIVSPAI